MSHCDVCMTIQLESGDLVVASLYRHSWESYLISYTHEKMDQVQNPTTVMLCIVAFLFRDLLYLPNVRESGPGTEQNKRDVVSGLHYVGHGDNVYTCVREHYFECKYSNVNKQAKHHRCLSSQTCLDTYLNISHDLFNRLQFSY